MEKNLECKRDAIMKEVILHPYEYQVKDSLITRRTDSGMYDMEKQGERWRNVRTKAGVTSKTQGSH